MYQELPCKEMLPTLIKKLGNESGISFSENRAEKLWERFEDGFAHFVVIDSTIVGCCVIWDDSFKVNRETLYRELGTLWVQSQYKKFALSEISNNIRRIAKGKKVLGFCKDIKTARFFVINSMFPFSSVANSKSCPSGIIESYQLEGWHPTDILNQSRYTRILYLESNQKFTSWYLIYE